MTTYAPPPFTITLKEKRLLLALLDAERSRMQWEGNVLFATSTHALYLKVETIKPIKEEGSK